MGVTAFFVLIPTGFAARRIRLGRELIDIDDVPYLPVIGDKARG
jgi:hypothetical protein